LEIEGEEEYNGNGKNCNQQNKFDLLFINSHIFEIIPM
jgi:hypothetical protein